MLKILNTTLSVAAAAIVTLNGMAAPVGAESNSMVRVAAIQCYSRMGQVEYNRKLLTGLIEEAAAGGAKIVVMPECAIHGYMDPAADVRWTAARNGTNAGLRYLGTTSEPVPGPATDYFAKLASKHGIYLCMALIERAGDKYYNCQVLLNPTGKMVAHHRKKALWSPGDGLWASEGDLPVQVVDSEYGKLGLMICYDVHRLPELLADKKADIVLYSVGWYGPNTEYWYKSVFPKRYVKTNHFAVIVANWSADPDSTGWPGHGYSCIIDSKGNLLNMAKATQGEEIVFGDLPMRKF
ncbi:MAG: carbon-nitrogen hydrolase family protein [bacterium]